MRWSYIFASTTAVLFAETVFALPTPNATHTLSRRSVVCGLNVRTAVAADCLVSRPALNFVLSGSQTRPSVTRQNSPAGNGIPEGSSCDHVVELQVLESAMQQSGMCQVVAGLNKLGVSRATQLQAMANIINGHANLLFLASPVNLAKANFVVNAMASRTITSANVANVAVSAYLRDAVVTSRSLAVAQQLDVSINAILQDAIARANAIHALPAGQRATTQAEADQQNFKILMGHISATPAANRITVTRLWNRVVHATVVNV
ncbi:hypothetical protein SISNIDRAFT_490586 [Sistotremastrum niveocremeum HHB9708]|uniref:Uncharacterized protein n=1 Tax=Sistotremastrum niveocremeum HHB9708 TaxID=1314777 RepID=A0A164NPY2_9AGAM|nr:hypothetical protein SISNIDRAFT_490586 [Sistotremastrum niveocremeum HHB9708]